MPRLLENFLSWFESRKYLLDRIQGLSEQRDAFEEECYDLRWHLERLGTQFAELQSNARSELDEMHASRQSIAEERDLWRIAAQVMPGNGL